VLEDDVMEKEEINLGSPLQVSSYIDEETRTDISLGILWELVMDREAGMLRSMGSQSQT